MSFLGLVLSILLLVFLFHGDPDVWDQLHAYAMHIEECSGGK